MKSDVYFSEPEGARLPSGLPPVVAAHVHLFPDRVFEKLWRWFETNAWPIRYKLQTPQVIDFLFSRGVSKIVALHYAHKPGMARMLNAYVAALAAADSRIMGLATVLPGEPDAVAVLDEGFSAGLLGVKLHCHVQCFSPAEAAMEPVYQACVRHQKPLVIHAGREPASAAYRCDAHALCNVERVEEVLRSYPTLKLCIPHLGADEFDGYERLLERHDNLWLDTTMMVADYFDLTPSRRMLDVRPDRILYGTDFPNLPYAWDRELKKLIDFGLGDDAEAALLGQNALRLFSP